ncbi:MAG: GTP-binding protein [Alphaproteobacteria bacterium]
MRIKTYTAPTITEAMALVKEELGDEAVIISTQKISDGEGMRIVAAKEESFADNDLENAFSLEQIINPINSTVKKALEFHRVPDDIAEKILAYLPKKQNDIVVALSSSLDKIFSFAPFPEGSSYRPFIIVGTPGSGKTITVAKLAARSRLAKYNVGVITADTVRAGAVGQLSAFTEILQIDLKKVKGPESLGRTVAELSSTCDYIYIDSPGINPFSDHDLDLIQMLTEAANAEPVLVLAAGGDADENSDIAERFASIGTARMIATRLDMTRRLGALLNAAYKANLSFCEVSINPHVASGLCAINSLSLARLILTTNSSSGQNLFD